MIHDLETRKRADWAAEIEAFDMSILSARVEALVPEWERSRLGRVPCGVDIDPSMIFRGVGGQLERSSRALGRRLNLDLSH